MNGKMRARVRDGSKRPSIRDRRIIESRKGNDDWLASAFFRAMHSSATDTGGVIQPAPPSPTRWHVLFSVLMSADSINQRCCGNSGSSPCFPSFLFFFFFSNQHISMCTFLSFSLYLSICLLLYFSMAFGFPLTLCLSVFVVARVWALRFILTVNACYSAYPATTRTDGFNCTPN